MSAERRMTRGSLWRWTGLLVAAATLAVLVWRLGTGPFLDGVSAVDGWAIAAAVSLGVVTTLCSAWRWTIVARGMGVALTLRQAVASYYRSQFLNLALPGGIVGDVHRGVSHGREVSNVPRGLRAVMWERIAGQVVQVLLTVVVLLIFPSPVRTAMPFVVAVVVVVAVVLVVVVRLPGRAGSRWARTTGAVAGEVRDGLLAGRAWVGVTAASTIAIAGYAATFVIAARAVGAEASLRTLLPLVLLAMLAMVLPSVAGLGPREGATAWAFSAAGLGAEQGVATAVVYGVMVLAASLPGVAVLVAGAARGVRTGTERRPALAGAQVVVRRDGGEDG